MKVNYFFEKLITTIFLITNMVVFSFNTDKQKKDSSNFYYKKGLQLSSENEADKAYKAMLIAKDMYVKKKINDSVILCNFKLYDISSSQNHLKTNSLKHLNDCKNYPTKKHYLIIALKSRYGSHYFNQKYPEKSANYFRESIEIGIKSNNQTHIVYPLLNFGNLYSYKYPDSSKLFFEKALSYTKSNEKNKLIAILINQSSLYQKLKQYNKAIKILTDAKNLNIENYSRKYNKIIYQHLANCYREINNYEKAYYYQSKYILYKDSINVFNQNRAITKIEQQYKNEKEKIELRQENILIEQKRKETELEKKQAHNLLYGSLIFLVLGGIITYLNLKNSRRKRLLAEQQKELEKQKNLTLLKEQEITTINAMVEGQEKERIRIAEDLHDNIGSVLATLKLHFENLKLNREKKHFNQEELYNKTEKLIDETYLKVRSIAHAKNAGVIANQGLLVAIKIMAEKISSANKLNIEIVDFGLDKRLDSNTEITVFRIIQELITNIIKHADASEATINISHFDDSLNIIIEDNGKGFNPNNLKIKNGMGLSSIKKRIEHLNGNFQIDSVLKRGTSIIINIPV
jgi:signal transduction histidine kinase